MSPFAALAPRPKTLADTGLSELFLADLVAKHLNEAGVLTLAQLSARTALAGPILESLLAFMRREARIEVRANTDDAGSLRYGLTDHGRSTALDALLRSGHIGPAPVPLSDYSRIVRAQTVHGGHVDRGLVRTAFQDVVINDDLLDQLGPAMNSGRAIFIYGPAGTGKTYITQRLARLFTELTLVPHSISAGDTVVQLFDPLIHKAVDDESSATSLLLDQGHDPRFVRCERPCVITGGELTTDLLEIQYDPANRTYEAPLQLKANNGIFIIDDLGRQRVAPEKILNRWIVPMEEKRDYHSLGSGRHFVAPFDVVLIFSTNMHPLDLADEAFLRRIGYKIHFGYLTPDQYEHIWEDACSDRGVLFDPAVTNFLIKELHSPNDVPLLPCHPRDLLGIALDQATYNDQPPRLTPDLLRWAWSNYFVQLKDRELMRDC